MDAHVHQKNPKFQRRNNTMKIIDMFREKSSLVNELDLARKDVDKLIESVEKWKKHYNSVWEEKEKVIAALLNRNDQIIKLINQNIQLKPLEKISKK